jgi:hypothetical protein
VGPTGEKLLTGFLYALGGAFGWRIGNALIDVVVGLLGR